MIEVSAVFFVVAVGPPEFCMKILVILHHTFADSACRFHYFYENFAGILHTVFDIEVGASKWPNLTIYRRNVCKFTELLFALNNTCTALCCLLFTKNETLR